MTDTLKLKFLPQQWSLFPFIISNVTPTNMLTSENMELETSDKREHVAFVFLHQGYLSQYDLL